MLSVLNRALVIVCLFVYSGFGTTTLLAADPRFGVFSGNPSGELLNGGKFELKKDFAFKDDKGRVWLVPAVYKTDGASIPQAFWSFIGSPFNGYYLNAAIIHDYFCDRRAHPWEDVHEMFWKAMRAGGVGARRAWVMYKAVYYFGPRWRTLLVIPDDCKDGSKSSPEDCVLNHSRTVTYHEPLNSQSFETLLNDLREDGYEKEAEELKEKAKF